MGSKWSGRHAEMERRLNIPAFNMHTYSIIIADIPPIDGDHFVIGLLRSRSMGFFLISNLIPKRVDLRQVLISSQPTLFFPYHSYLSKVYFMIIPSVHPSHKSSDVPISEDGTISKDRYT